MSTLQILFACLTSLIAVASITTSIIQYSLYKVRWLKYYLIYATTLISFLLIQQLCFYFFPNLLTSNQTPAMVAGLFASFAASVFFIINLITFPKLVLSLFEKPLKGLLKIIIHIVLVLFVFTVINIFFLHLIVDNDTYILIFELLLTTTLVSGYLTIFFVHLYGLFNWKRVTNPETKQGIFWFLLFTTIGVPITFSDWLFITDLLPSLYEKYRGTSIFVYSFLLFLLVLLNNIKRLSQDIKPQRKAVSQKFFKDYVITQREREVIECLIEGCSAKETAGLLFISEKTVNTHLYNIYRKVKVKNRVELIHVAHSHT